MTKGLKIALIVGGVAAVAGAAVGAVVALRKWRPLNVLVFKNKDGDCDCGCDCADENTCKYCSCIDCEQACVGSDEVEVVEEAVEAAEAAEAVEA